MAGQPFRHLKATCGGVQPNINAELIAQTVKYAFKHFPILLTADWPDQDKAKRLTNHIKTATKHAPLST